MKPEGSAKRHQTLSLWVGSGHKTSWMEESPCCDLTTQPYLVERLKKPLFQQEHMWQSRVEIEGYSIAYFAHIAVFEVLYR